ncbi:50S ribosomal protein L24 [Fuchsiella alkaliacetigena]|uniref:50S ribosomal protein L24 n=1 Tax=Fuchsiella alkaliacetigena TaxID=957042 RepID=UPI0035592ACC
MTVPKLHVRKDDQVIVIAGKDRGKRGKVLKTLPREGRVVVEGINVVHKHQQPTQEMQQGGIMEIEAPIDSSNVMLVCKHCDQGARTGKEFLDSGEKVRVCKKCGEIVD